MAISKKFKVSSVKIGATTINGITNSSDNLNSEVINDPTTGSLYPKLAAIRQVKPTAEFVTRHIATMLGAVGIAGVDISGLTGGIIQYMQKVKDGGSRDTSGHISRTINAGMIVLGSISASHGQDAELTVRVFAGFDGTNDPLVYSTGVTLPTDTDGGRFTLGPCTVESVTMTGVTSLNIDFGFQVTQDGADGEKWPTLVYADTCSPTITITCMDASLAGSSGFPIDGLAVTHANTTCYLRSIANGGTVEDDAETSHIKFTAAGLAHVLQSNDGSGMMQVKVECTFDGTNAPIVITTGSAIS